MPHEVITGFTTAPSTTLTALTMAAGDSLTIRKSVNPKLLNAWVNIQDANAGVLRVRSTLMHDATQGLRFQLGNQGLPVPVMPIGLYQPLQSQDVLTVEESGSATATHIDEVGLWVHYDDLPGTEGRFIDEATLRQASVQPFEDEVDLTPGAAGGYSGSKAINGTFDLFKAETDYAFIGADMALGPGVAPATVGAAHIGIKGSDTGNLRVPIPMPRGLDDLIARWFAFASREYGLPLIPIVNAANKAQTFVDAASSQAGTAFNVSLIGMQLTPEADKSGAVTNQPTSQASGGSKAGPVVHGGSTLPIGRRVGPAVNRRQVA